MRILNCGAVLLLMVIWAAAADDGTHAYLDVRLHNLTGVEIDQAAVMFDKHRCTSGVIGVGAHKTYMGWQQPVGTNAIVQWRDDKGVSREQSATLLGVYDRRAPGRLIFAITPTNVTVTFEKILRR